MDDESYFTLSGAGMPGNRGYYTSDPSKTPDEIKFRQEEKFPTKVMIWAVISDKAIGDIYVSPERTTMDKHLYQKECLSRIKKFIDKHYGSRDDVIFWPHAIMPIPIRLGCVTMALLLLKNLRIPPMHHKSDLLRTSGGFSKCAFTRVTGRLRTVIS